MGMYTPERHCQEDADKEGSKSNANDGGRVQAFYDDLLLLVIARLFGRRHRRLVRHWNKHTIHTENNNYILSLYLFMNRNKPLQNYLKKRQTRSDHPNIELHPFIVEVKLQYNSTDIKTIKLR